MPKKIRNPFVVEDGADAAAARDAYPHAARSRKAAVRSAMSAAASLGPGWIAVIRYNLIWYAEAHSKCGRYKVEVAARSGRCTASLGDFWTPHLLASPRAAVRAARLMACRRYAEIGKLLKNPPRFG